MYSSRRTYGTNSNHNGHGASAIGVASSVPRPINTSSLRKESGVSDVTSFLVHKGGKKICWGSSTLKDDDDADDNDNDDKDDTNENEVEAEEEEQQQNGDKAEEIEQSQSQSNGHGHGHGHGRHDEVESRRNHPRDYNHHNNSYGNHRYDEFDRGSGSGNNGYNNNNSNGEGYSGGRRYARSRLENGAYDGTGNDRRERSNSNSGSGSGSHDGHGGLDGDYYKGERGGNRYSNGGGGGYERDYNSGGGGYNNSNRRGGYDRDYDRGNTYGNSDRDYDRNNNYSHGGHGDRDFDRGGGGGYGHSDRDCDRGHGHNDRDYDRGGGYGHAGRRSEYNNNRSGGYNNGYNNTSNNNNSYEERRNIGKYPEQDRGEEYNNHKQSNHQQHQDTQEDRIASPSRSTQPTASSSPSPSPTRSTSTAAPATAPVVEEKEKTPALTAAEIQAEKRRADRFYQRFGKTREYHATNDAVDAVLADHDNDHDDTHDNSTATNTAIVDSNKEVANEKEEQEGRKSHTGRDNRHHAHAHHHTHHGDHRRENAPPIPMEPKQIMKRPVAPIGSGMSTATSTVVSQMQMGGQAGMNIFNHHSSTSMPSIQEIATSALQLPITEEKEPNNDQNQNQQQQAESSSISSNQAIPAMAVKKPFSYKDATNGNADSSSASAAAMLTVEEQQQNILRQVQATRAEKSKALKGKADRDREREHHRERDSHRERDHRSVVHSHSRKKNYKSSHHEEHPNSNSHLREDRDVEETTSPTTVTATSNSTSKKSEEEIIKIKEEFYKQRAIEREARKLHRQTRDPRSKGVLFQRLPDGSLVNVDQAKRDAKREAREAKRAEERELRINSKKKLHAHATPKDGKGAKGVDSENLPLKKENTDVEETPKEFVPAPSPATNAWFTGPPSSVKEIKTTEDSKQHQHKGKKSSTSTSTTVSGMDDVLSHNLLDINSMDKSAMSWSPPPMSMPLPLPSAPSQNQNDQQPVNIAMGPSWSEFSGGAGTNTAVSDAFRSSGLSPVAVRVPVSPQNFAHQMNRTHPFTPVVSEHGHDHNVEDDHDDMHVNDDADFALPRDLLSGAEGEDDHSHSANLTDGGVDETELSTNVDENNPHYSLKHSNAVDVGEEVVVEEDVVVGGEVVDVVVGEEAEEGVGGVDAVEDLPLPLAEVTESLNRVIILLAEVEVVDVDVEESRQKSKSDII
eukprot:CAMPEP_0194108614 /NCGR_PEP_ID=MMETSP0150-20130528/8269_1 /TAXON_ID=122233 /ORGANISM="Chaetoceros debilis, Strain MM31A-1" /LENGTH=1187 /DNA_ID=CAMNT_0038797357 /DNA_START=284 /DNA_END=3848 /DNA_ORIENTATION=-